MGRKRRHHKNLPPNMRVSRGAYYLTAYADGKQRWIPLGREYRAAFDRYAELTAYSAPGGKTIAELADRYEREILPALKPNTRKNYRSWMPAIRRTWGSMPAADLRQPDAAVFLDTYPHKVTANRIVSLLGVLMRKARRWGWIETNPLEGLEKNPEQRRKRIITPEEWAALLLAAAPPFRLLLRFARFTALRKGDICRLSWGDIRERILVATQKTEAPVSFQLAGELAGIVEELRDGRTLFPKLPVFVSDSGKRFSTRNLDNYWWAVRERAGLRDVVFHDIRRTRLTELQERYGQEFAQKVAAHADPRTTQRYYVPEAVTVDWPEGEIKGGKEAV